MVFNEQLDDGDAWIEGPFEDEVRGREYDHLCPECYEVIVDEAPQTRE